MWCSFRASALRSQVAELQERAAAQSQKQAVLQRSLEDRAAQVEVERVGAKALQMELSRAQEAWRRGQQQTAEAEQQLKLVANAVSRCLARVGVGFLLPQPPRHLTV